jgi:hypothetical protein
MRSEPQLTPLRYLGYDCGDAGGRHRLSESNELRMGSTRSCDAVHDDPGGPVAHGSRRSDHRGRYVHTIAIENQFVLDAGVWPGDPRPGVS